jgi:hypothetical protein
VRYRTYGQSISARPDIAATLLALPIEDLLLEGHLRVGRSGAIASPARDSAGGAYSDRQSCQGRPGNSLKAGTDEI